MHFIGVAVLGCLALLHCGVGEEGKGPKIHKLQNNGVTASAGERREGEAPLAASGVQIANHIAK